MNVWKSIPILRSRNRLRNVYMVLSQNSDHEKKSFQKNITPVKQNRMKDAPLKSKSKNNNSIREKRIQQGMRMNSSFNELDILD
ncbi:hypothetical protein [Paenibacillus montanisoli]|uniref:Uncharacterized protein n=1 Tax=Paenibacillus montanisoli TaxID=2081970 RepID=A0A328UC13_9BACL|nr:hypothetical protein [Paenibacillus montanisoli]RAP78445.1 hypothetical protein DL346_08475 [Paenibacillus montanisoli]